MSKTVTFWQRNDRFISHYKKKITETYLTPIEKTHKFLVMTFKDDEFQWQFGLNSVFLKYQIKALMKLMMEKSISLVSELA